MRKHVWVGLSRYPLLLLAFEAGLQTDQYTNIKTHGALNRTNALLLLVLAL